MNTPRFLGGITSDKQGGAWTVNLWENESAMRQYRNSGAHRQAMRYLRHWCDEASVVHWKQEDTNLPDAMARSARLRRSQLTAKWRVRITLPNCFIPQLLAKTGKFQNQYYLTEYHYIPEKNF